MGPGRSSSLRIGGDSSAVAGSRRTSGASDRLTGVALRDAPRAPPFPLDKGKGRVDQIKYPGWSEYLNLPFIMLWLWGLAKFVPCMGPISLGVTDLLLASESGPLMFGPPMWFLYLKWYASLK